jgi:glycosyltransferase involved in cell wall biosynthesis
MDVSVIIAARNEEERIGGQLDAVLGQDTDVAFEVVVADNGSTDATRDVVAARAAQDPRLRLVDASARPGTTFAQAAGVRAAQGRFLLFTDADDVVAPGWLNGLHAALQETGFAAARLEHETLNPAWTVAWRAPEQVDGLVTFAGGPPWPYGYGTSLAIRRDLHAAVSADDETLTPYRDMEYCYRVQRDLGARLVFARAAVVHYRHRPTLRATWRQAVLYAGQELEVQARFAPEWQVPLQVLSWPHLLLRNGRRLLKPDARGGALAPVSGKADLAAWLWGFGTDVGRRRYAAAMPA